MFSHTMITYINRGKQTNEQIPAANVYIAYGLVLSVKLYTRLHKLVPIRNAMNSATLMMPKNFATSVRSICLDMNERKQTE